jgi:glycosyltransferase involved in cell wall biosynthesis
MSLSVIILTLNEALHIQRCIELARPLGASVFVVDCFSTDQTVELARATGAEVVQHAWPGNQADQLNWALDNLPIRTEWVLRLDADEYLRPALIDEIRTRLDTLPVDINGVAFHLERFFMGRLIRRGIPDVTIVRLFRFGKARCERRLMDERMVLLEGRDITFAGSFVDHNLNDLGWWTQKHLGYAIREAADMLDIEYGLFDRSNAETQGSGEKFNAETQRRGEEINAETQRRRGEEGLNAEAQRRREENSAEAQNGNLTQRRREEEDFNAETQRRREEEDFNAETQRRREEEKFNEEAQRRREENSAEAQRRRGGEGLCEQAAAKRRMKLKYARAPLFWRALVYFCMRYFVRGGFLEGREGFMWHFFQGLWYRMLVDARIWEIKRDSGGDREKMLELLRTRFGLRI